MRPNKYIKREETVKRRKEMLCKSYQLKLDKSKFSVSTAIHLERLFLEAKWFYNWCVEKQNSKNQYNYKVKSVQVKIGNSFESRELVVLSSQMKMKLIERIHNSLSGLKVKKDSGRKVGKLKFKRKINSIPVYRLNDTYYLDFETNSIAIQGMGIPRKRKRWLKVSGLNQIPNDVEFSNANLIKKDEDYYLYVTTYKEKENVEIPNKSIGIDFGISTPLSLSDGVKIYYKVEVSKKLKRLSRKIQRLNRKPSKNKTKDEIKRRKEYQKLTNKKKDIRNKIVSAIKANYKYVCIQDDNIHGWNKWFGKQINNTTIGGIKADLKHKSHTPLVVDKLFPSTQICPICEIRTKHNLEDRTYLCSNQDCNYTEDRDLKSSICIEIEGLKQVPTDRRELIHKSYESTLGETLTSTFFNTLSKINGIKAKQIKSLNQEAILRNI